MKQFITLLASRAARHVGELEKGMGVGAPLSLLLLVMMSSSACPLHTNLAFGHRRQEEDSKQGRY